MRKQLIPFSKTLVYLFAVVTIIALLYEPHLEGRNINADLFTIYFRDPFLAYIYIAFVPFFVALYQVLKILRLFEMNKGFSQATMRHVRKIKYCALIFILSLSSAQKSTSLLPNMEKTI